MKANPESKPSEIAQRLGEWTVYLIFGSGALVTVALVVKLALWILQW